MKINGRIEVIFGVSMRLILLYPIRTEQIDQTRNF